MTIILNPTKRILLPDVLVSETKFSRSTYKDKIYFIETDKANEFMLVPASYHEEIKEKNIAHVVTADAKCRIYLSNFLKEQKIRRKVESVDIFVKNEALYLRV